MMKIMFVCSGNTCRSPIAEFVMKHLINEAGLSNQIEVSSSGSYAEIGSPISKGSKAQLKLHNIPFDEKHKAKQFTKSDYDNYDYIACMSRDGIKSLKNIVHGDPNKKFHLLLKNENVMDPFVSGDYSEAYNDIFKGCTVLLQEIEESSQSPENEN